MENGLMNFPQILSRLAAPFPADAISWRVGSTTSDKKKGMALAYIDARDVQDRLNEVCGPFWQCEHIVSNAGAKVTCRIGIKVDGEWIWRSNGAGDTDYEADKGSYSDAFKRAAVMFGVGRYLYDIKAPWVRIEQRGKSFVIPQDELNTLRKVVEGKPFTPSPPSNSHDPNWGGPMTKTELQKELGDFCKALADGVHMPEELDNLMDEYGPVLDQCRKDMPHWWSGGRLVPADFVPLKERIEAKRKFLGNPAIGDNTVLGAV